MTALVIVGWESMAVRFMDAKDIRRQMRSRRNARYLDARDLPRTRRCRADAVVMAMQHSGSVRYYTGRLTMRWDALDSRSLDTATAALTARGVPVYALIESWEEEDFRRRFAGQQTLARLDSRPMAKSADGELRLYALSGERVEDIRRL